MKKLNVSLCLLASAALLAACSGKSGRNGSAPSSSGPGREDFQGVVKGTAYIPVIVGPQNQMRVSAAHNFPVTVVNPPNVNFDISTADTVSPVPSNSMLDFGKIAVSNLNDNDLKVCGSNGNKKCSKAFIRIYTTGTAGDGLWNPDGYGMPMYTNQTGATPLVIGLDAANAATVQMVTIANNKRVLTLADFSNPAYELRSDFTNAGAGSYSTTLVIEYGLLE